MATVARELRILSLAAENNKALEERVAQLREVNQKVVAEISRLKAAVRQICERSGLDFHSVIRALV